VETFNIERPRTEVHRLDHIPEIRVIPFCLISGSAGMSEDQRLHPDALNFPLEFLWPQFNIAPMTPANFRVRRATVDDLDTLRLMWESMRLETAELERRLTEFQIAENAEGRVVGVVGFQIAERHACIHSEAFSDFALAETVRPLIWERMKALALNHGIARLWTREHIPFWKQNGFLPANNETLKKLPAAWNDPAGEWLTLPLKNEDSIVSLEKELAMFMAAEKQRTSLTFKHAHTLKILATALAVMFAIFVGGALFYLLKKNPGLLLHGR
jgi:N-acetylglutamate synthase-like GNAT family acetyltransferase